MFHLSPESWSIGASGPYYKCFDQILKNQMFNDFFSLFTSFSNLAARGSNSFLPQSSI